MIKKVLIVVGIAALIFIAGAFAGNSYWIRGGTTYRCSGIATNVFCKETNWKPAYEVSIIPGSIDVAFGGKVIFFCKRGLLPQNNCIYRYGP